MSRFLLKRFISLLPVLLGVSLFTFGLIHIAPGDPAEILLRQTGAEPTPEAVEAFRREHGLDGPLPMQYIHWLWRALHLDFGRSLSTGEPVVVELLDRLPATFELALASFTLMLTLSIPIGVFTAFKQNRPIDHLSRIVSILLVSIPGYWLGTLLIYFLSFRAGWLPVLGRGGWSHLVLPCVSLGLGSAAVYGRVLRERVIEVLGQDYIKLAFAKGLSQRQVVFGHILKNGLLPLVTMWGMTLGHFLGGVVFVETVFAWPGVGKLAVDAISNRDYPVVQCYVLFMALIYVAMSFLVDVIYQLLDPRISIWRGGHAE